MNTCELKDTLNTIRICGYNANEITTKISNIAYADKPPGAIILVDEEIWQNAILATPLVHFPRNAPIMFSSRNNLDYTILSQIIKLNPTGVKGIKIFLIGDYSFFVEEQLNLLGFGTKIINGKDFYETAARVAEYLEYPQNILVISGEDYQEGLCTCTWAAHSGDVILFTKKEKLPWFTRAVIQTTNNPNVYIVGSTSIISKQVEDEIRSLDIKYVDRISGLTPYEVAVNFAKYRSPDNLFGWGRNYRDGHAFTFTSIHKPLNSAASGTFGHLGKHTPILTVDLDTMPVVTRQYIESIKPIPQPEPKPPFMHGWIIGDYITISTEVQIEIEKTLSIDEEHMSMNKLYY